MISGNRGDNFLNAQGYDRVDRVGCGPSRDIVRASPEDNLAAADFEVSEVLAGSKWIVGTLRKDLRGPEACVLALLRVQAQMPTPRRLGLC